MKNILFLGYTPEQSKLHSVLRSNGCNVINVTDKNIENMDGYQLVISYGYRHILPQCTIDAFRAPVINIHISFLPYNRGAHPNFWAFYDNTPHGVTIHEVDAGIDTGPIIAQKLVKFAPYELSFAATYNRLINEIEALFIETLDDIINLRWASSAQRSLGSYHSAKDLPKDLHWDMNIEDYLRLHRRPIPDAWE